MLVQIPPDVRPTVLGRLREMLQLNRRRLGRSQELAMIALEGALLLADECHPRAGRSGHDPRIGRAIDHLLASVAAPPPLATLAAVAGLSRSQFALLFREQVGMTPRRFIEQHRLLLARRRLDHGRSTLQEIADQIGFSSPFYLSVRFKRQFGVSPQEYRRRQVRARRS
jgi:AraC family transcriptional regulator of arabinose operon